MRHYLFWADWKKQEHKMESQGQYSVTKNESGVKKAGNANHKREYSGAAIEAVSCTVVVVGLLVLILYPAFSAANRRLEMYRASMINKQTIHRHADDQQEDDGGFREYPVDLGFTKQLAVFLGVEDRQDGKEDGLGGGNDRECKLPPRPLGVTEPPRLFGTAVLCGLVVRWDVSFVGSGVPEGTPVLGESANVFGTSQFTPNELRSIRRQGCRLIDRALKFSAS
jgi:hypothetical protein